MSKGRRGPSDSSARGLGLAAEKPIVVVPAVHEPVQGELAVPGVEAEADDVEAERGPPARVGAASNDEPNARVPELVGVLLESTENRQLLERVTGRRDHLLHLRVGVALPRTRRDRLDQAEADLCHDPRPATPAVREVLGGDVRVALCIPRDHLLDRQVVVDPHGGQLDDRHSMPCDDDTHPRSAFLPNGVSVLPAYSPEHFNLTA